MYVYVLTGLCTCWLSSPFSVFLYPNAIFLPVLARSQMFHRLRNTGKQQYRETLVSRKTKTHPEEEDSCLVLTRWWQYRLVLWILENSSISVPEWSLHGISIIFSDNVHVSLPTLLLSPLPEVLRS